MFLLISLIYCNLSYSIFRRGFAPAIDTGESHQYTVHGSHLEMASGDTLYLKPTPMQQDLNLFTNDESDSEFSGTPNM